MRMTNKIMRNNSAYNMNQNKILRDKLTNQMTTQSKITRPSDDPVVAIRALRLRSNVSTVVQYNDKNAKDAEQWLSLTADAMLTVDKVLNGLYEQSTMSADKYEKSEDLKIILSQMKQLTAQFYTCANVDYAGRYVFSGYRTDLPVTFTAEDIKKFDEHPISYNINENFGFQDISRVSYTRYESLIDGFSGPLAPVTPGYITDQNSYEQTVQNDTLYRFRIAYDGVDSLEGNDMEGNPQTMTITMTDGTRLKVEAAPAPNDKKDANGVLQTSVTAVDADGNPITPTPAGPFPQILEFADQETAYKAVADAEYGGKAFTGIAYIPSSGELVFSKDFYDNNFSQSDFGGQDSFGVNYNKSTWENGDINPTHYFVCTETVQTTAKNVVPAEFRKTAYNTQRDEGRNQDIYYDVGFNQQIQVNTRADEIFTHDVQRDMDDFAYYLKQLEDIESLKANLEKERDTWPKDSSEYKDLNLRVEGADKAWTYIRDNIHTKFENQITKYQKYMDDSRVAMTDNATRGQRLELIKDRLTNQKATYKELQQDNEGIDITETAVELTASELTYNAALMATGKIMQTNLMNYI